MSKNIYVDFDGTLIDSTGCWQEAYMTMCKDKDYSFEPELYELFDNVSFDEWISKLNEKYGYDSFKELFNYSVKSYINRKPKQNVLNTISSIDGDVYILSREPKELILEWVNHYGLTMIKDIYQFGSERLEESFYKNIDVLVDDSLKYCIPAHNAGTYVIGVNDHHSKERQEDMKKICDEYLEEK